MRSALIPHTHHTLYKCTIVCVTHRAEPSAQRDEVRVVLQVEQLHLLNRGLAGGETPGLR